MKWQNKQFRGLLRVFIALALTLGILFLVGFVGFYAIYLTETKPLSSVKRSLYITRTTIGATFLTAWISTSVQGLLAKRLDCELENWYGRTSVNNLNHRWRAVMNLDDFFEKSRNLAIHIRYWIVALLTTALVECLTPTTTTRYFSFEQKIRNGTSTQMTSKGNCTGVFKLPLQDPT